MPPHFEQLTQQSLRDYGLLGTLLILSLIFGIVYFWKRPPSAPHGASPMQSVADQVKLIPLMLEELRSLGRHAEETGKQLDHIEDRLERMETLGHIVKDRLTRN